MTHTRAPWPRRQLLTLGLLTSWFCGLDAHVEAHAAPPASAAQAPSSRPSSEAEIFARVEQSLTQLDVEGARRTADLLPSGPVRGLALGLIAHASGDYDTAEQKLSATLEAPSIEAGLATRTRRALELVEGTKRALKGNAPVRSEDGRFSVIFADQRDEVIAPYLFTALDAGLSGLSAALDVRPSLPVRFEMYDAPESLSLATPLSLKAVYTTGTVGLCKYDKVMQLSPRTMLYGYRWADTVIHELTHLLVTLRSADRAPVWLQEGLAKLYETRWRRDAPPPLPAARMKLLRTAIEEDALITLEQMHPSIALLPSQQDAALAYAEVQTMLEMVWRKEGDAAIRALIDEVAAGTPAKAALAAAWGGTFDAFMEAWKDDVLRDKRGRGDAPFVARQFDGSGDGEPPAPDADVFSHLTGGRSRQFARVGLLLALQGHTRAAAIEFEKARAESTEIRDDPTLARELGRLYTELGEPERALPLLEIASAADPQRASLAADHGRALRLAGQLERARERLMDAVWMNPFIPSIHCDLAELAEDDVTRQRERRQCQTP
jgi:tetratricopeptide (TPR) repeat protein